LVNKFVIGSTGRSGTAYVYEFLKNLGVKINREKGFGYNQMPIFDYSQNIDGEISPYVMPFMKHQMNLGITTIVQLRNPIDILNSMLAVDRWVLSDDGPGRPFYFHLTENLFYNYICPHGTLNQDQPYIDAMRFILGWFRFAEGAARFVYKVEDICYDESGEPTAGTNALLECIDVHATPTEITNAFDRCFPASVERLVDRIPAGRKTNHWKDPDGRASDYTWTSLRATCQNHPGAHSLMSQFTAFATAYGYDTGIPISSADQPPISMDGRELTGEEFQRELASRVLDDWALKNQKP